MRRERISFELFLHHFLVYKPVVEDPYKSNQTRNEAAEEALGTEGTVEARVLTELSFGKC